MNQEHKDEAGESRAAGRWLLLIIGGFFAVIFAANGVFVWLANSTHSGPVTQAPYEKGLDYNTRLAAAAAEAALGWTMTVSSMSASDGSSEITLVISDADQAPLSGLQVVGRLVWPVTNGFDQSLSFTAEGEGAYRVRVKLHQPGQWELRILARQGEGDTARSRRFTTRVML
jgi:nitrogen fixation protein FixH